MKMRLSWIVKRISQANDEHRFTRDVEEQENGIVR